MTGPVADAGAWLHRLGDVDADRAREIAATDADLVVTDVASYARDETPCGPHRIDAMRGMDDDRVVVSYPSVGEAEDRRFHWNDKWTETPPSWFDAVDPE